MSGEIGRYCLKSDPKKDKKGGPGSISLDPDSLALTPIFQATRLS